MLCMVQATSRFVLASDALIGGKASRHQQQLNNNQVALVVQDQAYAAEGYRSNQMLHVVNHR
jgi:hypothetical protein